MTEGYNHLNDNGILLLTLRDEDVGDFKYKNDSCGNEMLWSYYGFDESHNWLILKKEMQNK